MRLYSGRRINRSVDRRFRTHTESRDAIVWDVDEPNGIARCKVQGSDEYILCHYSQSWQTLPYFVKPGYAVRIIHKGGSKGFQEISGPGRAIPSPVAGDIFPPPPPLFDAIMTGMLPTAPGGGMYVSISSGTFRIANLTYTFNTTDGGTLMESDSTLEMGADSEFLMGTGANSLLVFDAAPAIPLARYDLIVVGIDGIADVVKGTASGDPQFPVVTPDHVKIAHVLILGGSTEITTENINAAWEIRRALSIGIVASQYGGTNYVESSAGVMSKMYCSLDTPNPSIQMTATILDQFGWPYAVATTMTVTMDVGNDSGHLSAGSQSGRSLTFTGSADHYDFVFTRGESLEYPEGQPVYINQTVYSDSSSPEWPGAVTFRIGITEIIGVWFAHTVELLFGEPP